MDYMNSRFFPRHIHHAQRPAASSSPPSAAAASPAHVPTSVIIAHILPTKIWEIPVYAHSRHSLLFVNLMFIMHYHRGCTPSSGHTFPHKIALLPKPRLRILAELLLRSNDGASATYSQPCDSFQACVAVVLHHICRNIRTRAPETCLAVHGDCSTFALTDRYKALHDAFSRVSTIFVIEVVVVDASLGEAATVIALLVEPHHGCHTKSFEERHVVINRHCGHARFNLSAFRQRAAEGNELPRYYP